MRIIVDIGHPCHIYLFQPILSEFENKGYHYLVVARDKDITLRLLQNCDIPHVVLAPGGRGLIGKAIELAHREFRLLFTGRDFRPDIIMGTSVNAARAAKILGAKSIIINEDDASAVPLFRWLAYPFATYIVTPDTLKHENYGKKHLTYPSYQELLYLHPNRFLPDKSIRDELNISENEPYAVLRLSALRAHHDIGARGISDTLLREVIGLYGDRFRIFITSEKELPAEFGKYKLPTAPERIHHVLAFADFFLGDSQTMTMEAAMLGVPAFRINSFTGKISYLSEAEDYGLAFGFLPGQEMELLDKLRQVLTIENRKAEFRKLRDKVLSEKIDPLPWFMEVVEKISGK